MTDKRLGDFEILKVIGEGGMGKVYLARNVHLPTMLVALKILKDQTHKERFLREAVNLSFLDHKNICQLRHFFEEKDDLVIAMQYVDGKTLSAMVKDGEIDDLEQIRDIFVQVLNGLSQAHKMQVFHRDVKPSNIMIDKNDTVKIIDFGIARHLEDERFTSSGVAVGTAQYMAPEQFGAESISDYTRCDIYSVGISLYELCCGELPFKDTNPFVLKEKHCKERPRNPSRLNPKISGQLEEIILKAIEKRPYLRFQTAAEMRDALQFAQLEKGDAPTTIVSRLDEAKSWFRNSRNRPKIRAFTSLLVVVMALIALVVMPIFTRHGEEFPLPQVVGKSESEAQEILKQRDLSLQVAGREFSESRPEGVILSQLPEAGMPVKSGRSVNVIISAGMRVPEVPDVVGLPLQQAILILQKAGFAVGDIYYTRTDTLPPDAVVETIPTRGTPLPVNSKVSLAVSQAGSLDTDFEVTSATVPPQTYNAALHVVPSDSRIIAPDKTSSIGAMSMRLPKGSYRYTILNRSFPIYECTIVVNSESLDTTIDMSRLIDSQQKGKLAVAVWNIDPTGQKVDSREVLVNGFDTGHMSKDSVRTMIPGTYQVGIATGNDLRIDSVFVNKIRASSKLPEVVVEPNKQVRVVFFCHGT